MGGGAPLPALHLIVPYGYSLPFFGLDCKINCKDAKNCHIWNKCAGFEKSGVFYACKRRRKQAREEIIKKAPVRKAQGFSAFSELVQPYKVEEAADKSVPNHCFESFEIVPSSDSSFSASCTLTVRLSSAFRNATE